VSAEEVPALRKRVAGLRLVGLRLMRPNRKETDALHRAATWRKLFFNTRSQCDMQFAEMNLNVIKTRRQQPRAVFGYPTVTIEARCQHKPAPRFLRRM